MSFVHGKNTVVLVDQYNLSAYFNGVDAEQKLDTPETTTFGKSAKTYLPGLQDGSLSLSGLFDGSASAVDAVLAAALAATSDNIVSVLFQGAGTQGSVGRICKAIESSYKVSAPVSGVVSASANFQPDDGQHAGVLLHLLQAETTATNTTAVDNAALTSNGAVANLHVTAFTGTNIAIKVQHSVDNVTFADLITFNSVTGVGAQQGVVTGTVNRYLRVIWSGTFTSATFAVVGARL